MSSGREKIRKKNALCKSTLHCAYVYYERLGNYSFFRS